MVKWFHGGIKINGITTTVIEKIDGSKGYGAEHFIIKPAYEITLVNLIARIFSFNEIGKEIYQSEVNRQ